MVSNVGLPADYHDQVCVMKCDRSCRHSQVVQRIFLIVIVVYRLLIARMYHFLVSLSILLKNSRSTMLPAS